VKKSPRQLRAGEYEAELWAHAALEGHGVAVPTREQSDAAINVFFAIEDAVQRGRFGRPKQLAAEATEWSGWECDNRPQLVRTTACATVSMC
jgi:hypothetical protein